MCNICVQHFGDDTQALQCSMCNVQCAMCTKRVQELRDIWKLPNKEEFCKEGGCCTMQNAQCTMNNYTAKHGTPAHGIFWVQFVQQIGHHTMCSFLSLFGILLLQCTACIVCSIPWRFLVFCIRNVQLIFISPCVLRLTFTACSISWLHLVNFHGSFLLAVILFSVCIIIVMFGLSNAVFVFSAICNILMFIFFCNVWLVVRCVPFPLRALFPASSRQISFNYCTACPSSS